MFSSFLSHDNEKTIPASKIREYKNNLSKIGIRDDTYITIKNDLDGIKNRVIEMDMAYDMAGVFMEKAILAMRLVTYGNLEEDLNKEDLHVILKPYDEINKYIKYTQNPDEDEGISFVYLAMPLSVDLISHLDIKDIEEYRKCLRSLCIVQGQVNNAMVGISLTLGYCLTMYGMESLKQEYIKELYEFLEKYSVTTHDILIKASKIFQSDMTSPIHGFAIPMSILLNETNTGEIPASITCEYITRIRSEAIRLGHKYDFLEFLDGNGFESTVKIFRKLYTNDDDDDNDEENDD